MSDLTRRVLAIAQTDPVVTVCTVPDNDVATLARLVLSEYEQLVIVCDECGASTNLDWMIDAAPALARAVLAVADLADRLDRETETEREKPNRTLHDHGWDDAYTVAASRIRTALNGETND